MYAESGMIFKLNSFLVLWVIWMGGYNESVLSPFKIKVKRFKGIGV